MSNEEKEYECYGRVIGTKYLETVLAENAEEAKDKAFRELDLYVGLCHECDSEVENLEVDEIDAVPMDEA